MGITRHPLFGITSFFKKKNLEKKAKSHKLQVQSRELVLAAYMYSFDVSCFCRWTPRFWGGV